MAKKKPPTPEEMVKKILETPFWIDTLGTEEVYQRVHDDHDGTFEGRICISISSDGDVWLSTDKHRGPPLRFRCELGGGASPRVRNALLILAEAIRLDNLDRPEKTRG